MSADLLRRAAGLMRERAEAATPGRYIQNGVNGVHTPRGSCIATTHRSDVRERKADAEHIAGMDPTVALAVADWLDFAAQTLESVGHTPHVEHAVTVARAYLREQS